MSLLATSRKENVVVIELRRPREGNALNRKLQRELAAAWEEFEKADDLWIAILHGEGGVFSIGHDVEELEQGQSEAASPVPEDGMFPWNLRKPVIAAVEGPCYGLGFELAISCDLRVASQGSLFGFPDQNLYVSYRVATVLLPRMTNVGFGLELLFGGKTVGPERMRELRLVNMVVPKGEALGQALEAAKAMVQRFGSEEAFQKRQIWQLSGIPIPSAMNMVRRDVRYP